MKRNGLYSEGDGLTLNNARDFIKSRAKEFMIYIQNTTIFSYWGWSRGLFLMKLELYEFFNINMIVNSYV